MHNLDDMIEKYRYELMEFSKQNSVHSEPDAGQREAIATAAVPIDEYDEDFETNVNDYIVIRPYADYGDFERRNDSQGRLKVQVFAADRSFPIKNARVTVSVPLLTGSKELFSGITDMDGIADNIVLPAPSKSFSLDEDNTAEPFALYSLRVRHPNFADGEYYNVPVFDSVKSIQPVELVPLTQTGNQPKEIDFGGVE